MLDFLNSNDLMKKATQSGLSQVQQPLEIGDAQPLGMTPKLSPQAPTPTPLPTVGSFQPLTPTAPAAPTAPSTTTPQWTPPTINQSTMPKVSLPYDAATIAAINAQRQRSGIPPLVQNADGTFSESMAFLDWQNQAHPQPAGSPGAAMTALNGGYDPGATGTYDQVAQQYKNQNPTGGPTLYTSQGQPINAQPPAAPPGPSYLPPSVGGSSPYATMSNLGAGSQNPAPSSFQSTGTSMPNAATGTPGSVPSVGGAANGSMNGYSSNTPFGPGNDLRSTQIAPSESSWLQSLNGTLGSLLDRYTGYNVNPFTDVAAGSYAPNADTTQARGSLMQVLQSLNSTPDRDALAKASFENMLPEVNQQFAASQRAIGQNAGKFGTIGSAINTSNLADMGEAYARALSKASTDMALTAAGQTMSDRLARVGANQGVFGALGDSDRADAGVNLSLRQEARGERDAKNSYSQQGLTNARAKLSDVASLQDAQRVYEAANRGELRGERGYQGSMENQAYNRSVQATTLADQLQSSQWQKIMQMLNLGLNGSTDLTNTLLTAAGNSGQQAQNGYGDLAAILASVFSRR